MDTLFSYICENANYAHLIIFCLLLLSGLNLPISEDLMLLGGGALAATCIPDHAWRLYTWIFLGCYLSAWIAYWIGRLLGPRLYQFSLFKSLITIERLDTLRHYYAKFGIFTFIIGRFMPGGMRNALFMSSGLIKMPFNLFILRDGFACLISTLTIFSIGYRFGENRDILLMYFHRYTYGFFAVSLIIALIALIGYCFSKQKNAKL